jgi:hypothetical protein
MAYSSIMGADNAPELPEGRDAKSLGPSDNSDSGSDTIGTHEAHADSDAAGTGERGSVAPDDGREGGDILPDRIAQLPDGEDLAEEDADAVELVDRDSDAEPEDEERS